jgi:hypothetical protein
MVEETRPTGLEVSAEHVGLSIGGTFSSVSEVENASLGDT